MKTLHGKLLPVMACILLVCGCRHTGKTVSPAAEPDPLEGMTLREKVSTMFFVRPESLNSGTPFDASTVAVTDHGLGVVTDSMRATVRAYPVGGVILFAHNIHSPEQLKAFTDSLHKITRYVCVDEEGGRVARVANNPAFGLPHTGTMETLAARKGKTGVRDAAATIGGYLKQYGFDIDFAPVADVNTNPQNIVIGSRAFSNKPEVAATMVQAYLEGLQKAGIVGCIKHFPGHGDTSADTHFGYAVSRKNLEQLRGCELIPFREGIKAGARMVMTAHISLPAVTGSEIPSTLSPEVLEGILRKELGFDGVIVTDAMEMGAITRQYSTADACVLAVKAGADVLLCVKDYRAAVDAIVAAVEAGEIQESRIDASVRRILGLCD